jgi:hypothetical protein
MRSCVQVYNQEISSHCWGGNGGGGIIHITGVTVQAGGQRDRTRPNYITSGPPK